MERTYPKFKITEKAEKSLRAGHPWVFGEEVTSVEGDYSLGDIVDVYSKKDRWLGAGYVNDNSKIRVRVISRNTNDRFDKEFYTRRVNYAIDYRLQVMGDDFSCCRLIFGEADQFPGLTVDLFTDIIVTEVLSAGTEKIKGWVYEALIAKLKTLGIQVRAIYERNEALLRDKEGIEKYKAYWYQEGLGLAEPSTLNGHVEIRENGICYDVDYIEGQKTGYFLDQKYNRLAAAKIANGRKVLDCFTHTGAFALNMVKGGAASVTAVDVSQLALDQAKYNASLNGMENSVAFVCADVFELLTQMAEKGGKAPYDYIILDPPAFTKSSATVKSAYKGYKEINLKAMKLLPRGGYLATCSCSHFMPDELFAKMLDDAAKDAGVSLRQIEARQQSPDHPILRGVRETDYLKFYLFQVV